MTPARSVLILTLLAYGAFFLWYGGSTTPLSISEADAMIEEIETLSKARQGEHYDPTLVKSFRVLTRADDGREFYMLNLMRLREKALYPEGSEYGDDPRAASRRYGAAVIPALLKRGSLPVFLGKYAGAFIPSEAAERWDQIGIIRYRSRRDMLDMAIELSRKGSDEHKWASLEKTIVFPVAPLFDFLIVRGGVFVLLLTIGGGLAFALRRPSA